MDPENPVRYLPNSELAAYAAYGLAMFTAATLERGLVNALAHHRIFLAKQDRRKLSTDPWEKAAKSGFQSLVGKVTPWCDRDPELPADLTDAVKRRNYLAHTFWYDKEPDIEAEDSRGRLIAELADDIDAFFHLNSRVIAAVINPGMENLGVNVED